MDKSMIFFLGLDGLDISLVEAWNLSNLQQQEHGKIDVPINQKYGVPMSPEVWASFLTGKHIVLQDFKVTNTPLTTILRLLGVVRTRVSLNLQVGRRIKEASPWQIHGTYSFPELPTNTVTFLDVTESERINVPYYNYVNTYGRLMRLFDGGKIGLAEYVDLLSKLYEQRKRQFLNRTRNLSSDVVFAYMRFPDALQHLIFTKPKRMKRLYQDLDNYIAQFKSHLKDNTVLIIVSDHGFDIERGDHSDVGFYSSNIPLTRKPTKITDFYKLATS